MVEKQAVTFNSLSTEVKRALLLLWKVREKSVRGVGRHRYDSCPTARGYGLYAPFTWSDLKRPAQQFLRKNGWNSGVYNAFMDWYDYGFGPNEIRLAREKLLDRFLKTPRLIKTMHVRSHGS